MEKSFVISHYNLFVEAINPENDSIIYNTRTGMQLKISNDLKSTINDGNLGEIPEEIFDKLIKMKVIIPMDENELEEILDENKTFINNQEELYEVVMPSRSCQLGCYYCGQSHNKTEINDTLIGAISERVGSKLENGKYKSLKIGWFGGEPLMALNRLRGLSLKLQDIAQSKGIEYTASMTTNGVSLKPAIYQELVFDHK